jgi:hypothetical protein
MRHMNNNRSHSLVILWKRLETSKFCFFGASSVLVHVVQRRFHAVNVVGNVALVAQETGLVVTIATSFVHRTFETSPSFLQNDFGDLNVGTERMIALEMANRIKTSNNCNSI